MTSPGAAEDLGTGAGADAVEERARAEARDRLRRGRVLTAGVAAALLVVVAVVTLLGGFRQRTDRLTPVAAGSLIATGPYEVTLTRATVTHRTSSDEWDVLATGTARTTGTTSISPPTGSSSFVVARGGDGEVQETGSVRLGDGSALQQQDTLTPGLPPVPWSLSFRFAADPGGQVLLFVLDQEYTTPYLFSDEKSWRPTREASTMTLPLERLPDKEF